MLSKVGDVVNKKRIADGLDLIGEISLFRRIETKNCRKQLLTASDPREAL